jgi:hypothetical protein
LNQAVARNDPSEAENLIAKFSRLEKPEGKVINLLTDTAAIQHALLRTDSRLFRMQDDLGTSIGWICRSDFVAFSAPPKRGKSWYMMEAGIQASLAGCKVLFVSLEMDTDQTIRRWWSAYHARPLEAGRYLVPKFRDSSSFKCDIVTETHEFKALNTEWSKIEKDQMNLNLSMGDGAIRVAIYPSGTLTLSMLEDELDNLAFYENYVPDVLIVDYADILKPETRGDKRFQLDDIWLRMRGIAQKRHLALITGSQTGRATMKKDAGSDDVAEHFGKIAHITKGVFLNQTKEEKEAGYIRIDCETQREGKSYTEQVLVLQALDIGRPYIDSRFMRKVNVPTRNQGYGI